VVPELIRTVINTAMQLERQNHLGAGPYERSPERRDRANGYKPKTVATRVGKITFDIPQVRESSFYPQALEKGLRSERALKLALAEMYVQGVSTRKVAAITEQLCGFAVSSTQVSQAAALLDEQLEAWRQRPLSRSPYLWLDAHYEKVRQDGQVRDAAVLKAVGLNKEGKRMVLGVSVSLSEQEIHWRTFLQSLVARGLTGVELVISDAHAGLKQARRAVFGGVPWQRCQFHLQQNAQAYVPRHSMKHEVAADIRAVFNAPNRDEVEALLARLVQKYEKRASRLANWMETNIPEGLTVFSFPATHQRRLRTANGLERLNREVRRRS
jgi:transposase-like protein